MMKYNGYVVDIDFAQPRNNVQISIDGQMGRQAFFVSDPSSQCILATAMLAKEEVEIDYEDLQKLVTYARFSGPVPNFRKTVTVELDVEAESETPAGVSRSKFHLHGS